MRKRKDWSTEGDDEQDNSRQFLNAAGNEELGQLVETGDFNFCDPGDVRSGKGPGDKEQWTGLRCVWEVKLVHRESPRILHEGGAQQTAVGVLMLSPP